MKVPHPLWRALVLLAVVAACSCGDTTTGPSRLPAGVWGGDHISMSIVESSTHLELDCAHGDIPAVLTVDRQGQFNVAGTYVREHGGPIRLGDTNEPIGTFALASGSSGRVLKCL